ncbi:hypothetical protein [Agromyces sp. NPDC058110]|uniref:hypothetical protein n=1 Tax=Agromyces sp. NPDC058110 TaxID=3346345 RepID=UPI0036D895E7
MPRRDPAARLRLALDQSNEVALASVLSRDVRLVVDSGDETGGELRGRAVVARDLQGLVLRHPDAAWLPVHVNGAPGLALRRSDGEVVGVLAIEADDAGTGALVVGGADAVIARLWLSTAPAKLSGWNRRRPEID